MQMKRFGKFNVVILFNGDRYGRDDCLTVDDGPLVEFNDASQDQETWPNGQFTGGRYYASTLLLEWGQAFKDNDTLVPANQGLCLCGHVRAWDVDGATMARVRAWLVACLIQSK